MQFVIALLLKAAKSAAVKELVLKGAELLVKRTDNTLDDQALKVIREVLDGTIITK